MPRARRRAAASGAEQSAASEGKTEGTEDHITG
ncbi:hypothetical protein JO379_000315 [Streptomyces syringium]|uniref:Uncharacterized protein n=1 Tax=Streptomyces syringium TaxID=76729 RepID=A0ABS4XWG3_9ACTN|nr:hypothetical protein [Streptomyces syringium]